MHTGKFFKQEVQTMKDAVREFIRKEGVIFPADFVVEMYAQALKFAGGLAGLIQSLSRKAGEKAGNIFRENYGGDVGVDSLPELLRIFFQEAGFGDLRIELDGNILRVEVLDSFLLKIDRKPEVTLKPLLGAIEGFVSSYTGRKASGKLTGKTMEIEI